MGAALDAAEAIDAPPTVAARAAADPDMIEQAVDLIVMAKKPLILTGGGAWASRAGEAINTLMDTFNIPVLGNSQGRAMVPEDGARSLNFSVGGKAAAEADVMIVLGAPRLSTLAEGRRFGIELKFQY